MFISKNSNQNGLTETDIRKSAPSVFADKPSSKTTDKFLFVPTFMVIQAMLKDGWRVMWASESRTRIEENKGYTKHMLRFRHPDIKVKSLGDSLPEVVLVNAHNGSSAYKLSAGLFRLVCMNGLMVKSADFDEISYRHSHKVAAEIVDGSARIINNIPQLAGAVDAMKGIDLSQPEKVALAAAASVIRFDGEENVKVRPDSILWPNRQADRGNDLWTTFNVVQENLIRGTRARDLTNHGITIRAVKSIDSLRSVNQGLWKLAEEMKKIKQGG